MNRRHFLQTVSVAALSTPAWTAAAAAPDNQAAQTKRWLRIAQARQPKLIASTKPPISLVKPAPDAALFLRWRMDPVAAPATLNDRFLRDGDSFILDFGQHLTGHLTFSLVGNGGAVDSPTRLKFTFGEVPAEVASPLDQYKGGLSRAWLQDETINLDHLPATLTLPRRYAFRYVKVDVIATSPSFKVAFKQIHATALTSAGENKHPLPAGLSATLRQIDEVSLATLRECMQTVFEDGPKRDRRLWIGDLRLQALTNYATFRNFDLVKRCLYLFAALPREDGSVAACVYEKPKPVCGQVYIVDYAALYAAALLDYARAANDWSTARDLWPVARRQMELLGQHVNADGLFVPPPNTWVFIDWHDRLDRAAAIHGVLVYSLRQAMELARAVGDRNTADQYARRLTQMVAAGRGAFFAPDQKLFVSGPKRQVSWATQAWMVLSGIATQAEGAAALRAVSGMPDALRPGGPYLYHHFVEALLQCGLKPEALDLIESYWGGMIKHGADTFWEVYDPTNPLLSPYGDPLINSYCHAWSCTPAYLLRSGIRSGI